MQSAVLPVVVYQATLIQTLMAGRLGTRLNRVTAR